MLLSFSVTGSMFEAAGFVGRRLPIFMPVAAYNVWHDRDASGTSPALTACFLALSPKHSARSSPLRIYFLLDEFFFFKVTVPSRILAKEKENGKIFLAEPILLTQQQLLWRRANSRDPLWRSLGSELVLLSLLGSRSCLPAESGDGQIKPEM